MNYSFKETTWENVDDSHDPERYIEFLEDVSDTEWAQQAKEASYRAIRPREGDKILDLGCGIGIDVDGIAEYVGEDGTVVGADNSESMIETARARYGEQENVRFVVDDATDLSFSNDVFDRSRTERVLQHVPAPVDAIQEMKRVTQSGGFVMATEPDWMTYALDMPDSEIASDVIDSEFAPVQNPSIGRKLYRLFREAEFEDVHVNSYSLTLNDAETAVLTFRLKQRLKSMINAGLISQIEADQWLKSLEQASERDQFLAAGSAFSVVARVP
ncbi:methyltransferase domain-containing protein [Natrialba sp. PRR66]|uniref:methyltransferase domain-containing protein n=1 Tax=Natrialba sp. PRR66 TaxID=3098146 RepID=UPI002B1D317B|nr:methyltransferase domain-containing protein [Natrialba sp. PRR66]